jgi:hypothetical protein
LPLANFNLPPTEEDGVMDAGGGWHRGESEPVHLGLTGERNYRLELNLPSGYRTNLPQSIVIRSKGVEYSADYTQDQDTLKVVRRFTITKDQIPAGFRREYADFQREVVSDMGRSLLGMSTEGSTE